MLKTGRFLPGSMVLALMPLPLLACPMALGAGVSVPYDDQTVTEFRPTGTPGQQHERLIYDGADEGFEILSWFGLHSLREVDFGPDGEIADTLQTSVFDQVPPAPEPGQSIEGITATVTSEGRSFTRSVDVQAGPMGVFMIGACRYDAFPIEVRVVDPDGVYRHAFQFVPALGIALLTRVEDSEGTSDYRPLSISPLPQRKPD